jgi:hypothetical protein
MTDPEEIRVLTQALAFAMRAGAKMARKKYLLLGIVIGATAAYAFQQKEKKSANPVRSVKNSKKDN